MTDLHKAALYYAANGWHVLPCAAGSKVPVTSHGVHDATTDPEQINAWWERRPNANMAVACGEKSGITVVDVDVDVGRGIDERAAVSALGGLPETLRQNTPRGGYHLIYKHRPGIKNARDKASGLLIRNDGGYVLVSPSATEHGSYVWTD